MKTLSKWLLFILAIGIISYVYDYQKILFLRPQSAHSWRQSDSQSLTLNYYQHGNSIWQPEVNYCCSKNNTGYAAPSEVPILYYATAQLYRMFGYHEWIMRALLLTLFIVALAAMYHTLHLLTHSLFHSLAGTLLLFSSPILAFYAINYLPNIASLSLVITGTAIYVHYRKCPSFARYVLAWIILSIATFFKITAYIGILPLLLLEVTRAWPHRKKWWRQKQKLHLLLLIPLLLFTAPIAWLLYAMHYNTLWQNGYFLTQVNPLWPFSMETVNNVWQHIVQYIGTDYFHSSSLWFLLFCTLFIITQKKHLPSGVLSTLSAMLLLTFLYIFLQFTHIAHDYFVIDLYIIPTALISIFLYCYEHYHPSLSKSWLSYTCIVVLLAINIHHCDVTLKEKYIGERNITGTLYDFQHMKHYLRAMGITPESKFIAIPDESPYTLYLLNQKGWTSFNCKNNRDKNSLVKNGAKFMAINNNRLIANCDTIVPPAFYLGQFGNISLYSFSAFTPPSKNIGMLIFDGHHTYTDETKIITTSTNDTIGVDTCKRHQSFVFLPYNVSQQVQLSSRQHCYYEISAIVDNMTEACIVAQGDDRHYYYYVSKERYTHTAATDSVFLRIPTTHAMRSSVINIYVAGAKILATKNMHIRVFPYHESQL